LLEIVREVGAAAGVAAVVGQALLSALYVSQARELKRLREWAGQAPEQAVIIPPRRSQPTYRRIGARHVAVVLVGLLVLAYGVTRLTGDDGGGSGLPDKPKRNVAAVKPGNVTVAVLNGTTVPGLAAALSDQVAAGGFDKGTISDYSDKQLAESVVQYAPGHQAEAKAVSRRVGISRREPFTADSHALAPDATVIVLAGADKTP
jgi:hypothetical protein